MFHFTAIVTCLAIAFYFFTTILVGKAREKFDKVALDQRLFDVGRGPSAARGRADSSLCATQDSWRALASLRH